MIGLHEQMLTYATDPATAYAYAVLHPASSLHASHFDTLASSLASAYISYR